MYTTHNPIAMGNGNGDMGVTSARIYNPDTKRLQQYLLDNDLDNQQEGIKHMLDELKVKYPGRKARVKA